MEITVEKLTSVDLLRKANSFTTGHDSHMSLAKAYKYGHSPIRTQLFWIEMRDIPLFCASQFVRSHVGVQWFQRSKRTDRGGEDFRKVCTNLALDICMARTRVETTYENNNNLDEGALNLIHNLGPTEVKVANLHKQFDRYAPTDLACLINAEAIINMSHKRLCMKASKETREIWAEVLAEIYAIDPDLVRICQKPCVATGICREPKCCGYIDTPQWQILRKAYYNLFE